MSGPPVSHGRGGAANINPVPEDTTYVDGEMVRVGQEGSQGDGAFSTGRGGAANIGDAGIKKQAVRADKDVVPETAVRPSTDDTDYHTGRGGAGNEHLAKKKSAGGEVTPVSLADKLKKKILGVFKK